MILGFTGTRRGLTAKQLREVSELLTVLVPGEVHHGDCVGADAQFDALCRARGIKIVRHPPTDQKLQAFTGPGLPPEPYLRRNHRIVAASEELLACPGESHEVLRSGTWATVRYAVGLERKVHLVLP